MVAWTNRWYKSSESTEPAREIGEAYATTLIKGLTRSPGLI